MSFKSSGPKTRPARAKPPPSPPQPTDSIPLPPSFSRSKPEGRQRRSSTSSHSSASSEDVDFHDARFPPAEEAQMVSSSHDLKSQANKQFATSDYSSALSTYDRAMAELPSYLDYEMAVLQSNIAACHMKLEQWKEAVSSAEKGLEGLEREMPTKPKSDQTSKENGTSTKSHKSKPSNTTNSDAGNNKPDANAKDAVIELPDDIPDDEITQHLEQLQLSDQRKTDITRIRLKLLLRHARSLVQLAKSSSTTSPSDPSDPKAGFTSSWSHLSLAHTSYTTLSEPQHFSSLPPSDQRTVIAALRDLPPQIEKAKQAEMSEMLGKLKELGNGILKPFGLSTDMFKATQDPGTGGWSLGFDSSGGTGGAK